MNYARRRKGKTGRDLMRETLFTLREVAAICDCAGLPNAKSALSRLANRWNVVLTRMERNDLAAGRSRGQQQEVRT